MKLNVKKYLTDFVQAQASIEQKEIIQVPDAIIETDAIKMIMISEVVPKNPDDYFYSRQPNAAFMSTTIPIFNGSGISVNTIDDIISKGIYITTAVKTPKEGYTIPTEIINNQLPILEKELDLFSNTKVIMLMGDVAKKAMNTIVRQKTKKNLMPSKPTWRVRVNEYYYGNVRVLPSYIITGGNLLIEKGKIETIKEDISVAMLLL